METQQTISTWGRETFGKNKPLALATRMNVEVAELVNALNNLQEAKNRPWAIRKAMASAALMECADVYIMLAQVAQALGGDLSKYVDLKMEINRRRQWVQTATGKMQHVSEEPPATEDRQPSSFREPGTGIEMSLGLWYVISDSGGTYRNEGFVSPEAAHAWAKTAQARDTYGEDLTLEVPEWDPEKKCWKDMDVANVVKGQHCYEFWMDNDPDAVVWVGYEEGPEVEAPDETEDNKETTA